MKSRTYKYNYHLNSCSLRRLSFQQFRVRMVARLLRDQLIIQLHTFLYLMPPFSDETVYEFVYFLFFGKDGKSAVGK